ncbi:hypothetical protein ACF0H5_004831 [Mactra antiquata]
MSSEQEVVAQNDPEEEVAEEEEEEEDLIDPVDDIRKDCESNKESLRYLQKLEECNNRVSSRSKTDETCHEEMIDWVHAVDHCVAHKLFSKLK